MLGIESASPEMRTRLNTALDANERLDNELVGHLVRQSPMRSLGTSPLRSQNTVEVRNRACAVIVFASLTLFTFLC